MKDQMIQPTPQSKARILRWSATSAGLVIALWVAANHYAVNVAPLPFCNQIPWFRVFLLLATSSLLVVVVTFFRGGLKTWRSDQFPAPGTTVFVVTRVSTGPRARAHAAAMLLLSALAAVVLIAMLRLLVFSDTGLHVLGLRACGS